MSKERTARYMRIARHNRVRRKINGTTDRPRLVLFRSLNHIYAQVIDDTQGNTLVTASSNETSTKSNTNSQSRAQVSSVVGSLLGQRAIEKGIRKVVFDAGGYKYHGRVRALADAAREAGLEF